MDSVKISAFNLEDPNATVLVYSNPLTGEYKFELPQGKYSILFEANGAEKTVRDIVLPLTNPTDSFVLPGTLLPKTDFVADLNVKSNKTLSVSKNDTIEFPLKVEPKSVLAVEHWLGDSLISTESFMMNDTSFVYKIAPLIGDNKIVFKLTDRFNNLTTSNIYINRGKLISKLPVIRPEYSRVIAQKQTAALFSMLKNRADEKLKKVIQGSNITKQQFDRVDDIISHAKKEALKSNISPDEVDKLALKVAVQDNVLTQAAVDLMARNTKGGLNEILKSINIYESNLKTWTDLQKFVAEKSNSRVQPEELNKIAADVLADIDTSIAILREKIVAFSEKFEKGSKIKEAVTITDQNNINKAGKWLHSVHDESIKQGLTDIEISNMIILLSLSAKNRCEPVPARLSWYFRSPICRISEKS